MFVFFVGRVVISYGWINADGFQTQTTQFSPLKTAAQSPQTGSGFLHLY